MARKKEIFIERLTASGRIDGDVFRAVQLLALKTGKTQGQAIEDGLKCWIAWVEGDRHLRAQIEGAMKRGAERAPILAKEFIDEEEAAAKGSVAKRKI